VVASEISVVHYTPREQQQAAEGWAAPDPAYAAPAAPPADFAPQPDPYQEQPAAYGAAQQPAYQQPPPAAAFAPAGACSLRCAGRAGLRGPCPRCSRSAAHHCCAAAAGAPPPPTPLLAQRTHTPAAPAALPAAGGFKPEPPPAMNDLEERWRDVCMTGAANWWDNRAKKMSVSAAPTTRRRGGCC